MESTPASVYVWLEIVSVAFALAYLALAIRQSLWCWPAALISVALWAVVVLEAQLYMDFALQLFYFVMAIYGWHQWRRGGTGHAGVRPHWWGWRRHALAVVAIVASTAAFWFALLRTEAAFPLLDSLTTVAAIVATFMVARKVMENWIYWFVIDSIYVWLYLERSLYGYAGLYIVYLGMIVVGFRAWLAGMEAKAEADPRPETAAAARVTRA